MVKLTLSYMHSIPAMWKTKIFEEDNKKGKLISHQVENSSYSFVFGSSKPKSVALKRELWEHGVCEASTSSASWFQRTSVTTGQIRFLKRDHKWWEDRGELSLKEPALDSAASRQPEEPAGGPGCSQLGQLMEKPREPGRQDWRACARTPGLSARAQCAQVPRGAECWRGVVSILDSRASWKPEH